MLSGQKSISYYGYGNNICIVFDHGFISQYSVAPANIDGIPMPPRLLNP
jgi:hypothetical protein